MVKKNLFIILFLICISMISLDANASKKIIPISGKCLVYFIRPSSVAFAIKFKIYDNEVLVDKLGHSNYIVYECDPGEHIFVIKSENTDFLEANLVADKVYVVECEVKMGALKARTGFNPITSAHKKFAKKKKEVLKLLNNENKGKDVDQFNDDSEEMSSTMKKFYENREKGKKIKQLTADMSIELDLDEEL